MKAYLFSNGFKWFIFWTSRDDWFEKTSSSPDPWRILPSFGMCQLFHKHMNVLERSSYVKNHKNLMKKKLSLHHGSGKWHVSKISFLSFRLIFHWTSLFMGERAKWKLIHISCSSRKIYVSHDQVEVAHSSGWSLVLWCVLCSHSKNSSGCCRWHKRHGIGWCSPYAKG